VPERGAAAPHALALQEKFDGDKVPSRHLIMPRCDLLNAIFARQHRSEFLCVSKAFIILKLAHIPKKGRLKSRQICAFRCTSKS